MSVLADIPRQATVKAQTSCLLISISRPNFRNLTKVAPDVGESVQRTMSLYALSKLFQCIMYTESLSNPNKKTLELKLLPTCELIEVGADVTLIKEHDDKSDFYFLYHGRVVATTRQRNPEGADTVASDVKCDLEQSADESRYASDTFLLGTMGPGSYFGEISIITGTPCRATVSTVSR